MYWIANKDSQQLRKCSQTSLFKKKYYTYNALTFQVHAQEDLMIQIQVPALEWGVQQSWTSYFGNVLMIPHSKFIARLIVWKTTTDSYFLFLEAIIFLSKILSLNTSLLFIIAEHLKNLI